MPYISNSPGITGTTKQFLPTDGEISQSQIMAEGVKDFSFYVLVIFIVFPTIYVHMGTHKLLYIDK